MSDKKRKEAPAAAEVHLHCHSCAMPLKDGAHPKSETLCKYCCDDTGKLKSQAEVEQGVAGWLKSWAGTNLSDQEAAKRAKIYLKAMPAWAKTTKPRTAK